METSLLFLLALTSALFFGGTPVLVGGIYFAVAGSLDIRLLFALSLLTTLVWDGIWYGVGAHALSVERIRSSRTYARNPMLFDKLLSLYGRHQYVLLFLSRFTYGTNSVTSVISGVYRMQPVRFFVLNSASLSVLFAVLWALSYVVHENIAKFEFPFSLSTALAILVAIALVVRWGLRRILDRYIS